MTAKVEPVRDALVKRGLASRARPSLLAMVVASLML
jgi:hypothetical protein